MCFFIINPQRRWKQKTAWKVVDAEYRPGLAEGEFWVSSECHPYIWTSGEHQINGNSFTRMADRAHSGFYVYQSKRIALDEATWHGSLLLRVLVDPEDFLYHSANNQVATYRRVFVPEDQPAFEFIR